MVDRLLGELRHYSSVFSLLVVIVAFNASFISLSAAKALAQNSGKELFEQRCAACHSIGKGRLVGPDLKGVNERRSQDWLLRFVKSAQSVINSGDIPAKALFDEFKIMMPDQALSDDQIRAILSYVKESEGGKEISPPQGAKDESREPTREEILLGQNLFQGKTRFANGGPSCISCHNVTNQDVLGGGILAKELTTVYSRLGAAGIKAIVSNSPFPVMQAAFSGGPFLESEVDALVAFLRHANKENTLHQPREYGWAMFLAGSIGVMLMLGFYRVVGRRRKRRSVNQSIYDRQIKSE